MGQYLSRPKKTRVVQGIDIQSPGASSEDSNSDMSPDMDQHLSTLKMTRVNQGTDTQSPSASNEDFNSNMSPEGDRTVSSTNETKDVQPINNETSFEALHTSGDSRTDTAPISILMLPTELILDIMDYLPPTSVMSLSYTCRTIRNKMNVSRFFLLFMIGVEKAGMHIGVQITWPRPRRLHSCSKSRPMLDRDGQISSLTTLCNEYPYIHNGLLFSDTSFGLPRMARRCLDKTGLVWICPHRTLTYDQATSHAQNGNFHRCGTTLVSEYVGAFIITWQIMKVSQNSVPSNEHVKAALGSLNALVCPHLRLNDACVANSYAQECRSLRWRMACTEKGPAPDCRCLVCSSRRPSSRRPDPVLCSFCGTTIKFSINTLSHDTEILNLHVERTVDEGRSRTSPAWVCQVADPADFEGYEQAWHASNAECWRKTTPDLHASHM